MKARLVYHMKEVKGNEIVEARIWQVPVGKDRPDGIKFSIVYIKDGERILGYDNAESKGYHRHYYNSEEAYQFRGIRRLLKDFKEELLKIRGRHWDES